MSEKNIYNILAVIQKSLKAPKSQYNSFGKYKYRSCEDIVEAVKPILPEGCSLLLSDEVINIGDSNYIKATAALTISATEEVKVFGYAREAVTKKGMDDSQITGAASSYARKYALNGLFAIDDTKGADTQDNSQPQLINETQNKNLNELIIKTNSDLPKFLQVYKVTKTAELNVNDFKKAMTQLNKKLASW